MIGYYDLRGASFSGGLGGYTPYVLRIEHDEHRRIRAMYAVDPVTLTPYKDISDGWSGEFIPNAWTRRDVDESNTMDIGL